MSVFNRLPLIVTPRLSASARNSFRYTCRSVSILALPRLLDGELLEEPLSQESNEINSSKLSGRDKTSIFITRLKLLNSNAETSLKILNFIDKKSRPLMSDYR